MKNSKLVQTIQNTLKRKRGLQGRSKMFEELMKMESGINWCLNGYHSLPMFDS